MARAHARASVGKGLADDLVQEVVLWFLERLRSGRIRHRPHYLRPLVRRLVSQRARSWARRSDSRSAAEVRYGMALRAIGRSWMNPESVLPERGSRRRRRAARGAVARPGGAVLVMVRQGQDTYKVVSGQRRVLPAAFCTAEPRR
jgi:DNA-directed RNA polymerase specialized sigma24 family protein